MEAFFDLIAPVANDLVDFVGRFWPSLLLIAGALLVARSGRRAPGAGEQHRKGQDQEARPEVLKERDQTVCGGRNQVEERLHAGIFALKSRPS